MDKNETDPEASTHAGGDSSPSITTSSESETFDTWTLVTPELTTIKCKKTGGDSLEKNEAEMKIDSNLRKHGHSEINKKDDGHTDGEMSDGISIISDSESGGRVSPKPAAVRRSSPPKRLSSQGSRFEAIDQDSDNTDDIETPTTYKPLTPPHTPDSISSALVNKSINVSAVEHDNVFTDSGRGSRFVQGYNVNIAFFVAIFIGILAILGRMKTDPNLQTTDLTSLYSKLNEILAKTSHIETMIQDAINGLDDRSYDQYSNMLIRIHELNEKFEANNLAMKNVLNQLTMSSDKWPNVKPPIPNTKTFGDGKSQSAEFIANEKYNSEKQKSANYPPPSYEKSKVAQEDASRQEHGKSKEPQEGSAAQDKYNRPKDEREDRKYKGEDESYKAKTKDFRDDKMNQKNGFKKHEPHRDHSDYKNGDKKQYESHEHNSESKSESHEHGGRYKNGNGNNERKSKNNNRQYGSGDRIPNSKEQEENWMDRRKRFREDARKNVDSNEYKRHSDEDANWYLDRGTGRQKVRKFEQNDKRS